MSGYHTPTSKFTSGHNSCQPKETMILSDLQETTFSLKLDRVNLEFRKGISVNSHSYITVQDSHT